MTTWITVCETCKTPDWQPGESGLTSGEALAALIEAAAAPHPTLATRRHACLMACETPCALVLQSSGKMGYALAGFAPDAAMAEAVVAYALHHAQSGSGVVQWALWPEAVKGRFQARLPPLPGDGPEAAPSGDGLTAAPSDQ